MTRAKVWQVARISRGTFCKTKDGLAYIGIHPRFPHACFALGYGVNGITFIVIAAEIFRNYFLESPIAMPSCFLSAADG